MLMSAAPNNRPRSKRNQGIVATGSRTQDARAGPVRLFAQSSHCVTALMTSKPSYRDGIRDGPPRPRPEIRSAPASSPRWRHDNDVPRTQILVLGEVHRIQHRLNIHLDALPLHAAAGHPAKDPNPVARRIGRQPPDRAMASISVRIESPRKGRVPAPPTAPVINTSPSTKLAMEMVTCAP